MIKKIIIILLISVTTLNAQIKIDTLKFTNLAKKINYADRFKH